MPPDLVIKSNAVTDIKSLSSPSKASFKGKQKEETQRQRYGWWDFVPLIERKRPPIQWIGTSVILTAHAHEPRVVGLCFPTSKQFTLPLSPPVSSPDKLHLYEPPSIIASSAQDTWVFAYFEAKTDAAPSFGCLWRRKESVDDWEHVIWWTFDKGAGAIQARWLNTGREWVLSESLRPTRLPHVGPVLPLLHPVLLVVTENHMCIACYIHPASGAMKMVRGSLCTPSSAKEGQDMHLGERVDGPQGVGRCTHAAIGVTYDESSILIAKHSSYISATPESFSAVSNNPMTTLPSTLAEPSITSNWDRWHDESTIELCEVKLSVEGLSLVLSTIPQLPIRMYPPPGRTLVDLVLLPHLPQTHPSVPSTPTPKHRLVTPTSSPALSHLPTPHSPEKGASKPPMRGSPAKTGSGSEKVKQRRNGFFALLCNSLDFGDFSSPPVSEVIQFAIINSGMGTEPSKQTWLHRRRERAPVAEQGVVVNMTPIQPTTLFQHAGTLVAVIHTKTDVIYKKDGKYASVGKFYVLRADLQVDEHWEAKDIVCPLGAGPPLSIAVSPNKILVAAVRPSTSFSVESCIFSHPTRLFPQEQLGQSAKWWSAIVSISMQKRNSPNDIAHYLSTLGMSQLYIETLSLSLQEVDGNSSRQAMVELIGIIADVFKLRSLRAKSAENKEALMKHFQVGHEICSMAACASAWEQCVDEDNEYDLDEVWHLVGLSSWFLDMVSAILKECVILDNVRKDDKPANVNSLATQSQNATRAADSNKEANEKPNLYTSSCRILHILHPFAFSQLQEVFQHVKAFHHLLGGLHPRTESAMLARDVLLDNVSMSGISLDALDLALNEIKEELRSFAERSPDATRHSLAMLQPLPAHSSLQDYAISKLMNHNVVDKVKLFLEPDDFVDGLLGLNLNSNIRKHRRDVVRMNFLSKQQHPMSCLRCDGETEIKESTNTGTLLSQRWMAWERSWLSHCICGGLWMFNPVPRM